jgi:hypothetical protein
LINNALDFRIRQPTMYNILSTNWKNQIPMRPSLNKHLILPQHVPFKEFNSFYQIPEYNSEHKPEYKSELIILPHIHQGTVDDDKGPIHTIPAPNLNPADKFYNLSTNTKAIVSHYPYSNDLNYRTTMQSKFLFFIVLYIFRYI